MRVRMTAAALWAVVGSANAGGIRLEPVGTWHADTPGGAEIVAYNAGSRQAYVTNAARNALEVLTLDARGRPVHAFTIDCSPYGGGVNSVDVADGLVAAAVEGFVKHDPGRVVLFNLDGTFVGMVEVGALPDMLTFTPDGTRILVANEGEPSTDYASDPEGSVSVIDVPRDARRIGQRHVRTADFRRFNNELLDPAVRIFGPGASAAQDLEPEYIALSSDAATAYVTCQENNALAIVDVATATVTRLIPLGLKDHRVPGNGMDASDKDGMVRIGNWPVFGMEQSDTIKRATIGGVDYFVCAEEGDVRAYDRCREEVRVKDLELDPTAFPNAAELQRDDQLGRLKVTKTLGDTDGDGDYDELYTFGGRGISVRDARGNLVYESGDTIEVLTAMAVPGGFNSDSDSNRSFDARSDDRGPEPEALTVGEIDGRTYAFVGLERVGGIVAFDITEPSKSKAVGYWTGRSFAGDPALGTAGDLAPEGFVFVPASDSPTKTTLLLAASEVSGTLTVWRIVAD